MGIFDKLKGASALPTLDTSSSAERLIDPYADRLADLADRAGSLEIVTAGDGLYVFVGKPPKTFGLVWYHDGEEQNFKKLAEERGLSYAQLERFSNELRDAYTKHQTEPRFARKVERHTATVIPSEDFGAEVASIVASYTAKPPSAERTESTESTERAASVCLGGPGDADL